MSQEPISGFVFLTSWKKSVIYLIISNMKADVGYNLTHSNGKKQWRHTMLGYSVSCRAYDVSRSKRRQTALSSPRPVVSEGPVDPNSEPLLWILNIDTRRGLPRLVCVSCDPYSSVDMPSVMVPKPTRTIIRVAVMPYKQFVWVCKD